MEWRELKIRLFNWEYWPMGIVYFPIFIYWFWLALKSRSMFFFTASNPTMENGGMLGESKLEILKNLPVHLVPSTIIITPENSISATLLLMQNEKINFPVITKPDIGERGQGVRKINSGKELENYITETGANFLIQEYVDLPEEYGVFYIRHPAEPTGRVTSIVKKKMLSVTGDGSSTIEELVLKRDRTYLHRKAIVKKFKEKIHDIPPAGDSVELISIGNHCKGTKFLNGQHLISETLSHSFDKIAAAYPGFYYGRFDLRTSNSESLKNGNFKIMELNGAGAEPAHIYDPAVGLFEAYRSLFYHWEKLYSIAKYNHNQGVSYLSLKEGIKEYRRYQINKKLTVQY